MSQIFHTEQWVASPIDKVFRFFSDPRNLPVISPPSSGARLQALHLIAPRLDGTDGSERLAGVGSEILVSVRLLPYLPLRQSWTARVMEYEWCRHFKDVQVRGPFKKFDHTNSFKIEERGGLPGTGITDHVEYDVGFGLLGKLANVVMVRSLLRQMFAFRHAAAERALES